MQGLTVLKVVRHSVDKEDTKRLKSGAFDVKLAKEAHFRTLDALWPDHVYPPATMADGGRLYWIESSYKKEMELYRLLTKAAGEGKFRILALPNGRRASRKMWPFDKFAEELKELGVHVFVGNQCLTSNDPMEAALARIQLVMSQQEGDTLSAAGNICYEAALKLGYYWGTTPPFGSVRAPGFDEKTKGYPISHGPLALDVIAALRDVRAHGPRAAFRMPAAEKVGLDEKRLEQIAGELTVFGLIPFKTSGVFVYRQELDIAQDNDLRDFIYTKYGPPSRVGRRPGAIDDDAGQTRLVVETVGDIPVVDDLVENNRIGCQLCATGVMKVDGYDERGGVRVRRLKCNECGHVHPLTTVAHLAAGRTGFGCAGCGENRPTRFGIRTRNGTKTFACDSCGAEGANRIR